MGLSFIVTEIFVLNCFPLWSVMLYLQLLYLTVNIFHRPLCYMCMCLNISFLLKYVNRLTLCVLFLNVY